MRTLRDELEATLRAEFAAWSSSASMRPLAKHFVRFFSGLDRQALVMAFDLAGVACSDRFGVCYGSSEPSPTLAGHGAFSGRNWRCDSAQSGSHDHGREIAEASCRILKTVKHLQSRN